MESLAYTLIFLLRGRLPWQGFEVWSTLWPPCLLTAVVHFLGLSGVHLFCVTTASMCS